MDAFQTTSGAPHWLTRAHLREKLDPSLIVPPEACKRPGKGLPNDEWRKFELSIFHKVYEAGDELWEYSDIGPLSGSAGYVLMRGGTTVVAVLTTLRS